MRIVYFVQYFNLPHEPGGSRPYQLAKAWLAAGHRVSVVTGAVNHKTLTVPERFRGRPVTVERIDGIDVVRVWSYAGIRGSFRKRLINFLSYAATAGSLGVLRAGRPDVVYASSTPLTVGLPGMLAAALRRCPWLFEVRDLWPESAVVAGVLDREALLTRVAQTASERFYRSAGRVVGVTQGIVEGLAAQGVPRNKLLFAPNGVDDWMLDEPPTPPERPGGRFRVVYCGAHGMWNGLDQVLDAAAELRGEPIELQFVGDGDRKPHLERRAREEGLDNVSFCDAVPKREAFAKLREASAAIIVSPADPFHRMVLANKVFDYLAAGRPVIAGMAGETAELVERAGCGVVVPPERPNELAAAIRGLAREPGDELARMGRAGHEHVVRHYSRGDTAEELLEAMRELVRGRRSR
jgi:glycosyltransferase involved in cell wall biosynthesis